MRPRGGARRSPSPRARCAALPSATSSSTAPLTCEKHHCKSLPPAGQPPPPAPANTHRARQGPAPAPRPTPRPGPPPGARPAPRGPLTCHGRPAGGRAGGHQGGGARRRRPPRCCRPSTSARPPPPPPRLPGRDFFFPFSKWRPMPVAPLDDVIPLRLLRPPGRGRGRREATLRGRGGARRGARPRGLPGAAGRADCACAGRLLLRHAPRPEPGIIPNGTGASGAAGLQGLAVGAPSQTSR